MSSLELTQHHHHQNFTMDINDHISIRLEENPTTGYLWYGADHINAEILTLLENQFTPPNASYPGQGGIRHFKYIALKKGRVHIELRYRRGWESDESYEALFQTTITITSS